jgi:hypothetical protein
VLDGRGPCFSSEKTSARWLMIQLIPPRFRLVVGYGSIPIHTIFRGMNIHLPAILMWTTGG